MVERVTFLTDDEQDQFESALGKPMVEFERFINQFDTIVLPNTPTQFFELVKEYVAESNHGGWDGFTLNDLLGIGAFMTDLMTYHNSVRSNQTK